MKREGFYLLCLATLISSCQSVPTTYFERPKIEQTIIGNCTGFQDGRSVDATNFIGANTEDFDQMERYVEELELRLYRCLRSRRNCK